VLFRRDETGLAQYSKVRGHGRFRNLEMLGQLARRPGAVPQQVQNAAAGGIGQCLENSAHE
jgi:hypothetical protein